MRNKTLKIYSQRTYDELKTFTWNGSKPQAMKGYNDDLIMSLAICVWVQDSDPLFNKDNTAINAAMLEAMSYERSDYSAVDPTVKKKNLLDTFNPFMPVQTSSGKYNKKTKAGKGNPKMPTNFDWLLKD